MDIKWKAVVLMSVAGAVISMIVMLLLCVVVAILLANQNIDISAINWIGCIVSGVATIVGCIISYRGLKNSRLLVSVAVATLFALALLVFGRTVFDGVTANIIPIIACCFGCAALYSILGSLGSKRGRRV